MPLSAVASPAQGQQPLCGTKVAIAPPQHVLLVMLENKSYSSVIGNGKAPFQNSLATSCGLATSMWGATHHSAANYLATSAGHYPATSVQGCNYAACADAGPRIDQQLDTVSLTWKAYEESMPTACDKSTAAPYKIGHNPPIFYTAISKTECQARDVGVADLTASSGAFWNDLHAGTLPAVSWITPSTKNDGENSCGGNCALTIADTWLQRFVGLVAGSTGYQSGSTVVFVTYDEGTGTDSVAGENCTDQAGDLAGERPSCQCLLRVYAGTAPEPRPRVL